MSIIEVPKRFIEIQKGFIAGIIMCGIVIYGLTKLLGYKMEIRR